MRKLITELTLQQAREILEFKFPNRTDLSNPKNYELWVKYISFSPVITEDGSRQVTMCGEDIIGIIFHNSQDNCILPFHDTKVMLWLYQNGFDILQQLEYNQDVSRELDTYTNIITRLYTLSEGERFFAEDAKQNCTVEYYKEQCKELYDLACKD